MSHSELYEVENRVGLWLGRALAVCAIVMIAFWIGGAQMTATWHPNHWGYQKLVCVWTKFNLTGETK
jgi:hypothetical protein